MARAPAAILEHELTLRKRNPVLGRWSETVGPGALAALKLPHQPWTDNLYLDFY